MSTTYQGRTIFQLLEEAYQICQDKELIYDGTNRYSYADLYSDAMALAAGLASLGVKKGDRVAVCLPTWYESIVTVFAVAKLGAIIVPFNTRYREHEAEYIIRNSGAKVLFFTKEYDGVNHSEQFPTIFKRVETLEHLITVRFEQEGTINFSELKEKGARALNSLQNSVVPSIPIDVANDVFAVIYTSGTTGEPKGAMLTHQNLMFVAYSGCKYINATSDDVFFMSTPFFHVMGLGGIFRVLACKARIVILEKYSVERTLELIEQERITVRPAVPTMLTLELNHEKFASYDLSSLRVISIAAAPASVELIRAVKEKMGCPVLVSYGLTETSPTLTYTRFDDNEVIQSETVGKAIEGVELKVVNDLREEVPRGVVGELACRSIGLMKGYLNMPEKTKEVIDEDGWFYTGDLVTMDDEGYIRIVGRKKDMIIRGGYNIYPREVEEFFCTHPAILEVAIVGLPDSVLGEISCAVLVLKSGNQLTADEAKEFIKAKVADYKVPDHILIFEDLPKTPTGKVKKFELREHILKSNLVQLR